MSDSTNEISRGGGRHLKATARSVALDLLSEVLDRGHSLDEALTRNRDLPKLAERDRAFSRLLAATVLRRFGQCDALIEACLDRPLKHRHQELSHLLRMGAAQLVFLETPPHAAVSTALDLVERKLRLAGMKGLVNAVLRRVAREGSALAADMDLARTTLPDWLYERWHRTYGAAKTQAIARALLADPPLDITVKAKADTWARRLGGKAFPWGAVRLTEKRGDPARLPGFAEGAWWVQDLAASLVVRFMGPVLDREIYDLCAAPGGKTAALAAAGARVTAIDRSASRVKRLKENLSRLGLPAVITTADALHWRPERPAPGVLLDAPCSATGILRRHPDIKFLRRPSDIESLARLQSDLLDAAAKLVAPGGTLLYVVCSLEPEEGPERIAAFLAAGAPFRRQPICSEEVYGQTAFLTPEGDFVSLPCDLPEDGGIDGFYACRLTRAG